MTEVAAVGTATRVKRFLGEYPVVSLLLLLAALIVALEFIRPGIVNERWIANTIKFAIPLAMLASCQTLTMLTGGIDLSVGTIATISSFVMATQMPVSGPTAAIFMAIVPAVALGMVNGFGVGVCRVHPLIMTLGTGLIGIGCLQVYQRFVIATGSEVPGFLAWLGTGRYGTLPHSLLLFVPFAAAVIFMLRRTGFGRLLYALGENENASRLAGVREWQVYIALYALSGLIAGMSGLLYLGLIKAPSLSLVEPRLLPAVAAAVIGGTSIFGGRGTYSGTIVGALILTVLTTMLTVMQIPEGTRRLLFGAIILAVTAVYLRLTEDG